MDKEIKKEAVKKGFIQKMAEKFGNKNRKKAAKGMKFRQGIRYKKPEGK